MKKIKLINRIALLLIIIVAIGCSSDSIHDNALEESIDQTKLNSRSLEYIDGEKPPSNPSDSETVAVLVIYPWHWTMRERRDFATNMNNHYTIYSRHRPFSDNPFGSVDCSNVVKWIVNEAEYDAYQASSPPSVDWPPPPTDGAGGQPVTKKQDTDDDEDQPIDPRWGCF